MISSVYNSRFHYAHSTIELVELCFGKLQLSPYIVWIILNKGSYTTKQACLLCLQSNGLRGELSEETTTLPEDK